MACFSKTRCLLSLDGSVGVVGCVDGVDCCSAWDIYNDVVILSKSGKFIRGCFY